ncbi:hypothetical protein HMN09_00782400 [Mycena chlorophos]|uniref:NAD(P)-binding protein n=1 Tax=Mycena chlorophos TaxID=658473 RepID=A0A8H6ST30_MYCCL|nr:hypothetical protein HMN09_00782400 [Mycena chlorophos]
MPSLAAVKAANAKYAPPTPPVAVFFGGTSGIGRGTAQAFARYTSGNAHIVIVGRNKAAADELLAALPKHEGQTLAHEFIACDTSLMKNVDAVTRQLVEKLPKINFLCISSGNMTLLGRKDTEEGIDYRMAVQYYSRWKIIHDLVPLLRAAAGGGEVATVLNVLDPARGIAIADTEDFGLKKPGNFTPLKALQVLPTYTSLTMEEFGLRNPNVSFIHIAPGFVNTNNFNSNHWSMRLAAPIIRPAIWAFASSPEVCAEYMLYAMLNAKKGFSRVGEKADDMGLKSFPYPDEKPRKELREKVWAHTVKEVEVQEAIGS